MKRFKSVVPVDADEIENPPNLLSPSSDNDDNSSIATDFQMKPSESESLKILINYLSKNIDDLRVLNATALNGLEKLTRQLRHNENAPTLHYIIKSHGWTTKYGWIRSLADFDTLLTSLSNLYFVSKADLLPKIYLENFEPLRKLNPWNSNIHEETVAFSSDLYIQYLYHSKGHFNDSDPLLNYRDVKIECCILIIEILDFDMIIIRNNGSYALDKLFDLTTYHVANIIDIIYQNNGDGKNDHCLMFVIYSLLISLS
jgi:hypothetical protein